MAIESAPGAPLGDPNAPLKPYYWYETNESEGILVRGIYFDEEDQEILPYLHARGLDVVVPLDYNYQLFASEPLILCPMNTPYGRAMRRIHEDEEAGRLDEGSYGEAEDALYDCRIENTPWYHGYVLPELLLQSAEDPSP